MPYSQPEAAFDAAMQLGECPLWHPDEAALYWIDIPGRAVHRLEPDSGKHQSWPMPGEPGCIARCAKGLIVALRGGLFLLGADDGSLQHLADPPYDTSKLRFNDGRCDGAGRLWVGTIYEPRDQVLGSLFRIERNTITDMGKRVTVSNGVAFSPDYRTLYHADTTAHRITAYDFDLAAGTIGAGRVLRQFSTDKTSNYGGRPDGAAVDSEGAYWCAMMEGGRLLRLSPDGEILAEVALPVRCPTMVAFGDADLRTLYITSGRFNRPEAELEAHPLSGYLLKMRVDVPGRIEPAYLLRD
jgi:sugar lactone lactonase YvrE